MQISLKTIFLYFVKIAKLKIIQHFHDFFQSFVNLGYFFFFERYKNRQNEVTSASFFHVLYHLFSVKNRQNADLPSS